MELTKLLNSVRVVSVVGETLRREIGTITSNSRDVKQGTIFVAVKGYQTDGHKYIQQAISAGADAIVLEDETNFPNQMSIRQNVVKIVVKNSRKALAELSNAYYKEPSSKLLVIAVTGTNGKTTTTYFIKSILEAAGHKTGLIGTITNLIGDTVVEATHTTPESNHLYALLARMVNEGCSAVVLEASSHALYLNRLHKLSLNGAVFTNLTSDHLDFHNTTEEYASAKKILFDNLESGSFALVNADDAFSSTMLKDCKAESYSYGITGGAPFQMSDIKVSLQGTSFLLHHKGKEYSLRTSLIGEFNAYNAAAAFSITTLLGVDPEIAMNAIANTPAVPGRFEVIGEGSKKVIVDYSHTADSLEKAIRNLRHIISPTTKLYTVFGCGGNRDTTKRPIMGSIATELSNFAIVTNDNPRNEDPQKIVDDILKGITKENFAVQLDREKAIAQAIEESPEDSVILIAGKGHENYQIIQGVTHHFSDKEMAEKYLKVMVQ